MKDKRTAYFNVMPSGMATPAIRMERTTDDRGNTLPVWLHFIQKSPEVKQMIPNKCTTGTLSY